MLSAVIAGHVNPSFLLDPQPNVGRRVCSSVTANICTNNIITNNLQMMTWIRHQCPLCGRVQSVIFEWMSMSPKG